MTQDGPADTLIAGATPEVESRRSVGAKRNPASEAAILDAAEAILAEKGLGGFSIEAVARRARAGKPTIYRWWPNRTSLLLAVYQRQKGDFHSFDHGSLEADAAAFVAHLLTHWKSGAAGEVFRSVIAEAQSDPTAARVLAEYSDARHAQTANIFRRAMARGEVPDTADPVLAAEMLASFARGRLLLGRLDISDEELHQVVRQFVRGLRA